MEKVWTKEEIKAKISENDNWAIKGMLAIYARQTNEEKSIQETVSKNGVGFNGTDARIMSSIAEFYIEKKFLSAKQMVIVRKKMPKYAGQLAKIANGEIM